MNIIDFNKKLDEFSGILYNEQLLARDAKIAPGYKERRTCHTKEYYQNLLSKYANIIAVEHDASLDAIREAFLAASHVEDKMREFVHKMRLTPGLAVSFGTRNFTENLYIGNRQDFEMNENGIIVPCSKLDPIDEDTYFDIASVSKLLTSLSILQLLENGKISLEDDVTKYAPMFENLKGVTILDLLYFEKPLITKGRVDGNHSREEAEKVLFTARINENFPENGKPYNDIHSMVLKYVIEGASEENIEQYIRENILDPLKMDDTTLIIPPARLDNVASVNYGVTIKKMKDGNFVENIDSTVINGQHHDPKARALAPGFAGHAGYHTTPTDFTKLARAFINFNNPVVNPDTFELLYTNHTGRGYIEDDKIKYIQYYGAQVNVKHPIEYSSEVNHNWSGAAFASEGFTGTQITSDIAGGFSTVLGTKINGRAYSVDSDFPDERRINVDGADCVILSNGQAVINSSRYVYQKDDLLKAMSELVLAYRFIEYAYRGEIKSVTNYTEKTKVLAPARMYNE